MAEAPPPNHRKLRARDRRQPEQPLRKALPLRMRIRKRAPLNLLRRNRERHREVPDDRQQARLPSSATGEEHLGRDRWVKPLSTAPPRRPLLEETQRVAVPIRNVVQGRLLHGRRQGDRDPTVRNLELSPDRNDRLDVDRLLGVEPLDRRLRITKPATG